MSPAVNDPQEDEDEFLTIVKLIHSVPAVNDEIYEIENKSTVDNRHFQVEFTEEIANLVEEIEMEEIKLTVDESQKQASENELLYENARVTVGESLLLVMAFIMRHNLSMVASSDLLELLELHCPKENRAVKELSRFQPYFKQLNHPIKQHYCCPNSKCQVYTSATMPKEGDVCKICGGPSGKSFFIEVPVEDQLQTILSLKCFYKCIHFLYAID